MLASLLPGLRHLRAPLASGYISLFGLWLLIHPLLPPPNHASGPLKDILDLADYSGKPAVLVASSFAAYLIGTLIIATIFRINNYVHSKTYRWNLHRFKLISRFSPAQWQDSEIEATITDVVANKLAERFLDDQEFRALIFRHVTDAQERATKEGRTLLAPLLELSTQDLERQALRDSYARRRLLRRVVEAGPYIESTGNDLNYVAQRLLGREDALYGEYDREQAEGTFLASVVLPLAFIFIVLAFRSSSWWLVGLLVPLAFIRLWVEAWTSSSVNLGHALAAGRVETPALERLLSIDIELVPYEKLIDSSVDLTRNTATSSEITNVDEADATGSAEVTER